MDWTTVLAALITALGGIGTTLIIQRNQIKAKQKVIDELNERLQGVGTFRFDHILVDLGTMNVLQLLLKRIFDASSADRFLILIAYNGTSEIKYCNVIYEQHGSDIEVSYSIGASETYSPLPVDDHYRQLLHKLENTQAIYLKTSDMENSLLKDIYIEEKLTESRIQFVKRKPLEKGKDVIIYFTIATHKMGGFNSHDRRIFTVKLPQINHLISNTLA